MRCMHAIKMAIGHCFGSTTLKWPVTEGLLTVERPGQQPDLTQSHANNPWDSWARTESWSIVASQRGWSQLDLRALVSPSQRR